MSPSASYPVADPAHDPPFFGGIASVADNMPEHHVTVVSLFRTYDV